MKRYIRSAKSTTPNYNYYLLDFVKKLGIGPEHLKVLQDRSGNLRDSVYFGRGYSYSGHGFPLSNTRGGICYLFDNRACWEW